MLSSFWSIFVIVITLAMIFACLILLFSNSHGVTGEVKDHVWDGDLREYNNPLPRWWFNLFLLTIAFGIGYLLLYPGLGNLPGRLGWTSAQQTQQGVDELTARRQEVFATLKDKDVAALSQDASARALGRAVFLNNCAGCHGADAHGAIGFPNLTDQDWIFGGTPEAIVETITHGRQTAMPPFKDVLQPDQLQALVDFVPFWSDATLDPQKRERGLAQFAITCAGCHGPEGKGNPIVGAPNLTDSIWLFGGGKERVRETILGGRQSQMPAHEAILSPDEIRVVAAYVYGLSHGSPSSE